MWVLKKLLLLLQFNLIFFVSNHLIIAKLVAKDGVRPIRSLAAHGHGTGQSYGNSHQDVGSRGHSDGHSNSHIEKLISYYKYLPIYNSHEPSYGHGHTMTSPVHQNYGHMPASQHQSMPHDGMSGHGHGHSNDHNNVGHMMGGHDHYNEENNYHSINPSLEIVYELASKAISASRASQAISNSHHHGHDGPSSHGHRSRGHRTRGYGNRGYGSNGHSNSHTLPHMDTYTTSNDGYA